MAVFRLERNKGYTVMSNHDGAAVAEVRAAAVGADAGDCEG